MKAQRKFVTSLVLLALLFSNDACTKKKPVLPPQAPAPTLAEALPDEIPEKPEEPTPEVAQAPVVIPPVKSKPKRPTRTATSNNKKTVAPPVSTTAPPTPAPAAASPPTQAPGANTQIVATARTPQTAAPESTPDLAIAAAIPSALVSQQKEETVRMVDATENTLKGINRSLSDNEKAMRTQIQSYLQQSRKATADGDVERAYNLAKKAQLLADALTKK